MAAAKGRSGSRTAAGQGKAAGAKGNASNGAAAKNQPKNQAKNQTPAPAKTPSPARAARAAAPARAKSGADAARPVGSGAARRAGNRPGTVATAPRGGASRRDQDLDPAAVEYEYPAAWLRWTTFALALIGLGVSIYLTYAHYTESALAGCTETTGVVNCGKVTTSPQSVVFGIPVAVLGLAFYVFAVAIMNPWAWKIHRREVGLLRLASLIVGIGFVLYLVYAELFDIGSICLYCTSVHVITFLLFVLTGLAVAVWGVSPRAQVR
jgi:uncharacterized membrane protein